MKRGKALVNSLYLHHSMYNQKSKADQPLQEWKASSPSSQRLTRLKQFVLADVMTWMLVRNKQKLSKQKVSLRPSNDLCNFLHALARYEKA